MQLHFLLVLSALVVFTQASSQSNTQSYSDYSYSSSINSSSVIACILLVALGCVLLKKYMDKRQVREAMIQSMKMKQL